MPMRPDVPVAGPILMQTSLVTCPNPRASSLTVDRIPTAMPRRLLTTIALLLMLAGISQPAIAGPGAPSLASSARAIEPPNVTAQAVFSFDLTTGITLYEKNPHERMQVG